MPQFTLQVVNPKPNPPVVTLPDPLTEEAKRAFGSSLIFSLLSHPPGSQLVLTDHGCTALNAAITPDDLPAEPRPSPYDVMDFDQMGGDDRVYVYIIQAMALANPHIHDLLERGEQFSTLNYLGQGGIGITFTRAIES